MLMHYVNNDMEIDEMNLLFLVFSTYALTAVQ